MSGKMKFAILAAVAVGMMGCVTDEQSDNQPDSTASHVCRVPLLPAKQAVIAPGWNEVVNE